MARSDASSKSSGQVLNAAHLMHVEDEQYKLGVHMHMH